VSWYDFQLISVPSQVELCLVGYMRETDRHPFQKCVQPFRLQRSAARC